MIQDKEVYERLDSMLPGKVPRWLSESAIDAGEPESAISDLLDAAYSVGALSQDVIDYIESVYTDGPVIDMLEALQMIDEQRHR